MCPLDDVQRARLTRLRAQIVFALTRGSDAPPLLLDAARQLGPLDAGLAREAYLEALGAAIFAGRLNGHVGPREVATDVRNAPAGRQPPGPTDLMLDGLATRFTEGYNPGVAPLRRALDAFGLDAGGDEDAIMRWFWLPFLVASDLWDDDTCHELATRAVRLCREAGALNLLPLALGYRALVHLHAGEFAAASALTEEADAIEQATGNAPAKFTSLLLTAWRGVEAEALELFSWGLERRDRAWRGTRDRWLGLRDSGVVQRSGPLRRGPCWRATGMRIRGPDPLRLRPRRASRGRSPKRRLTTRPLPP